MYTVEKSVNFEAGHRLMNYDGKCKFLHGHNYVLTIGLSKEKVDKTGFVRDFSEIKEIVSAFINEHIDHGMILCIKDARWIQILTEMGQKVYILEDNPTAENIAKHLFHLFKNQFAEISYIKIQETPSATAFYQE